PDQVAGILDEVSGAAGPLRGLHAVRDRGVLSTRYELTGDIDLSKLATGITADPELVQSLTGQQVDLPALDASLAQQLQDSVSVGGVASLRGGTTTISGSRGRVVTVDASSSVIDPGRIVLVVGGVVLVRAAVVVRGGGRRRRRAQVARRAARADAARGA